MSAGVAGIVPTDLSVLASSLGSAQARWPKYPSISESSSPFFIFRNVP